MRAPLRPTILDRNGAALDPTKLAQSLHKGGGPLDRNCCIRRTQDSDDRQLRQRLRTRSERPQSCAAQESDELPTPHPTIDPPLLDATDYIPPFGRTKHWIVPASRNK